MRKFLLTILSLMLVASLAGAAYLVATGRIVGRIAGVSVTTETLVKAGEAATHSPQDKKVLFHEWRIATQPNDAQAYRLLAHSLVSRAEATGDPADYDRAGAQLDHAERIEPDDLRTIRFRVALLQSRHRFAQARATAEQGLLKDPEDETLIGHAGDAAIAMGDLDGAEIHYRKLTNLASKSQGTWANLSYLAEMRGDLDEAAALMSKALDAGYKRNVNATTLAWLHTILGEIEAKRSKLDVARDHYQIALKKAPDHRLAREFTADLDVWQSDLKSAEAGYRRLIAEQFDPKIQIRLADLLERRGEKAEASRLRNESLRFFERVVAGGNEGFLRDLARLDLAAGRYGRAARLAARDAELRPTAESRMLYASISKNAAAANVSLE